MKQFYFLMLAILALTTSQPAFAQEATISGIIQGKIIDESQKPIDYVTIGLFRTKDSSLVKTAFTLADGKFQFLNVNKGSYYIKASLMGYTTYGSEAFDLTALNSNHNIPTINLKMEGKALNAVNITAVKPLIERKTDKLVMNVENSSIAIGSTALEVLQRAPGVSVDQNDRISMQGKQGVLILLDGKQTYMSSADVANLLRNMESSQIESIELITNPSAKYDASGNSGIINIKTKKNKNGGTNGSINAGVGYGEHLRHNTGLNLNNRTQYVNVFGNYSYGNLKRDNYIAIDRVSKGQQDTYFMQKGDNTRERDGNNFKAGVDVFINKNNTIGLLINGYLNKASEFSENKTLMGSSFQKIDSTLLSNSVSRDKYDGLSYNLNYKSVLDTAGQEISIDLDYSKYYGKDGATYTNNYWFSNGTLIRPTQYTRNTTPTKIDIKAFKTDYTVSLNKTMKLDAGLKSSWVKTDNNFIAEEKIDAVWQNDIRKSNRFIYDENVNAAYANLNKQFKSLSVQLGLRMEQTNSTGNLITNNNVVKRSYVDFFPSIFVNQTFDKYNQVGLSYSRRIDRPSYDALNPFIYYLDQYTYNKGNPFLNPQYTHNFEVSYTFKQKYLLSLNYSRVNDVIIEVILPDESKKALYQTTTNLAKNISYSANLNVPVKIAKWWEMNNNLNVFYLSFESPDLAGKDLKTGKTSFQFKSQQNFTIVKGFTAELMGNYESPLDYGTLSLRARYGIDLGLSKSLLNNKASLKLAVSDVFNTQDTRLTSTYPGLSYNLYQKNESQIARISFSYRFGKNEIKPARRRTTGTEAEQGRVKN